MGHVNLLNLDIDSIILLETIGTQALRDLMEAGYFSWSLLVAPRLASVTLFI